MEGEPRHFRDNDNRGRGYTGRRHNGGRKRLRILVVHDFDLNSSAKLAESPLLSSNNIRSQIARSEDPLLEKCVDFCIAINTASEFSIPDGLYDPGDELLPYYHGQQKRNRLLKTTTTTTTKMWNRPQYYPYSYTYNGTEVDHLRGRARFGKRTPSSSYRSIPVPVPLPPSSQPTFNENQEGNEFHNGESSEVAHDADDNIPCDSVESQQVSSIRNRSRVSPEERAARRGLVTAALSQLESIVCRVVYVLKDDSDNKEQPYIHRRLTSNSLDIRNRWLPLVDGLGVAGLVKGLTGLPTDPNSGSFSDENSDSEYDSCDDNPTLFSSKQDQDPGQKYSCTNPSAVVSPCHTNGTTEANSDGANNYSRLLERLLQSAYPLRTANKNHYNLADGERYFPQDQEAPRFQTIVVAAASSCVSRMAPLTERAAKSDSVQYSNKDEILSSHPSCIHQIDDPNASLKDQLLLEIAAGAETPPSSYSFSANESNSTTTVVIPGSLRTRGEFCLVDLVLDGIDIENENIDSGIPATFNRRWRHEKTHFHRLESEDITRH